METVDQLDSLDPEVRFTRADSIELSVVMPCLDEADTLRTCIEKARTALRASGIAGEIIVADNGSTDDSRRIATGMGARVVPVQVKGYGNALMGGIAAARGKYIVMGDADDSYDFLEIPRFLEKLRGGADLVQGCRFPAGGGRIMRGAMPLSHRWIGNPMFSRLVRHMFDSPVRDVYCGLRAFTKECYKKLDLRCTGMEFATEMIIKASLYGARIAEVPITLWPDGRKSHPPHLKTLRDGWRTLRFYLMYCPRWLFFYPGIAAILLGIIGYAIALPGLQVGSVTFDAHTLLFASLSILIGYQSTLFAFLTKLFAVGEGLLPTDIRLTRLLKVISLERGLLIGCLALVGGGVLLLCSLNQWRAVHFGHLDYARTMRWVVPGVTLTVLGVQTVLNCFFISILLMRRR